MSARPVIAVPADRRVLDPHPFHVVGEKYIIAIEHGAGGGCPELCRRVVSPLMNYCRG